MISLAKPVSLTKRSDSETRGFDSLTMREFLRCSFTKHNYRALKQGQLRTV